MWIYFHIYIYIYVGILKHANLNLQALAFNRQTRQMGKTLESGPLKTHILRVLKLVTSIVGNMEISADFTRKHRDLALKHFDLSMQRGRFVKLTPSWLRDRLPGKLVIC